MSGETERDPSGWTPDLLFLHLNRRIESVAELASSQLTGLSRMLDERYATQTKALEAAFAAAEKAVEDALLAAEKAVDKANTANERRFESVNEFRAQLGDQTKTMISRAEADAKFNSLDGRISEVKSTLDKLVAGAAAGKSASHDSWGYLVGAVGLIAVLITTYLALAGR